MPDHRDRAEAARLLRLWLDGSLTNHQFDDSWPWDSADRAVVDIGRELWSHFSDHPEMTLRPALLDPDETNLLERCVTFLESSLNYLIPLYPEAPVSPGLLRRIMGTKSLFEVAPIALSRAEHEAWPFTQTQWANLHL